MSQKRDPFTGQYFHPNRSNQIFASRENQIAYNNANAKFFRDQFNEIDSIIKKNWKIIDGLLGDECTKIIDKATLINLNFNFSYFNNKKLHENVEYICLYNYGIIPVGNEKYEIINLESYE